jgi:hypothetical protein
VATVAGTATLDGLGLITGSRAVAVVDETVTAVSTRRGVRPHLATPTAIVYPAVADVGAS